MRNELYIHVVTKKGGRKGFQFMTTRERERERGGGNERVGEREWERESGRERESERERETGRVIDRQAARQKDMRKNRERMCLRLSVSLLFHDGEQKCVMYEFYDTVLVLL